MRLGASPKRRTHRLARVESTVTTTSPGSLSTSSTTNPVRSNNRSANPLPSSIARAPLSLPFAQQSRWRGTKPQPVDPQSAGDVGRAPPIPEGPRITRGEMTKLHLSLPEAGPRRRQAYPSQPIQPSGAQQGDCRWASGCLDGDRRPSKGRSADRNGYRHLAASRSSSDRRQRVVGAAPEGQLQTGRPATELSLDLGSPQWSDPS